VTASAPPDQPAVDPAPAHCIRPKDPHHRESDWRLKSAEGEPVNPWCCGLCHEWKGPERAIERRA
jgi:hypothetical protein